MKKMIANRFPAVENLKYFNRLLVLLFCVPAISQAQVNLITNGDFETGTVTGFTSNYTLTSGPNTSAGQYGITTDPGSLNSNFSSSCQDHSATGAGYMMVVDGSSNSGDKVWEQSPGGGIQVVAGKQYTFSYWISNISNTNTTGFYPELEVRVNGAVLGSALCPPTLCGWTQVSYTFTATSNYVQIWIFDKLTSFSGNDFALDDLELKEVPPPLTVYFSLVNPTCPGVNDGFIVAYAKGGTPPYTYSFNSGPMSSNNILTGLAPFSSNTIAIKDAANTIATNRSPADIQPVPNPLSIKNDTTVCSGANVQLWAAGSNAAYSWTANPTDASLTSPNIANPVVSPGVTTTYTVTSSPDTVINLIYNGDFSQGDVGFATDYNYYAVNQNKLQQAYSVLPNPNSFEPDFSSCGDITTGTGNMLVADGSLNSSHKVWCQQVPVKPSTTYTFTYWMQTLVTTASPAVIETQINGLPITGNTVTSTFTASTLICGWHKYSTTWNSGANTTAEICLYDRNNTAAGNDFALDDISFTTTVTCTVQKSVTVTVSSSGTPVTGFSYSSPSACKNGSNPTVNTDAGFTTGGTFSATPTGLIINTSTGAIDVAASTAGDYIITYTVAASGCLQGQSSQTAFSIYTNTTPITGFRYTPDNVCANGANPTLDKDLAFTAGGAYTASPAGLIINNLTGAIDVAASAAGTYTITYTVNASGCTLQGSGNTAFTINPASTPVTGFSYTPNTVCANESNPLLNINTGFTTGGTYSSTAGLSINANTGAINVALSTPGTYTVTYAVAATGCAGAASGNTSFTINPTITPVTDFTYSPNLVCTNSSNPAINTNAGFTAGGTFSATPQGLDINPATGIINIATSNAGIYTVTYNVLAAGCQTAKNSSVSFTITAVSSAPVTQFSYTTPVCKNDVNPVPVTAAGFTTGGIFTSSNGLIVNANSGAINLSASTPGTYTVTYTVAATACNPGDAGTANITVNDTPLPPSAVNGKNCGPGIVTLTATNSGGTVKWYTEPALTNLVNTGTSYSPSLTSTQAYYITETIGNCTSNSSIVTATIGAIPQPPFLGNDTSICGGDQLTLDAGSYANYTWQDGSGARTFVVKQPGSYSVIVGNSDGCTSTSGITVSTEAECSDIYFPSAFAPDGKNKLFGPVSPTGSIGGITNYSLTVYNRYGQIVFASTNPLEKWDGTFKGKKMGNNSFVWYARYLFRGRNYKTQKGSLVIIR